MRVLFTSFPAYGHLHPLVPLALAAQEAGHDVRVASGVNLTDWISRCGLPAEVVGLSEDDLATTADRQYPGPLRTAHMFVDVWVACALPGLLRLAETWRPDVVVHEEEEYAGVLLAELLGVPCVTQSWSAPARPVQGQRLALELLTPLWSRHTSTAARRVGALYLDACPPAFQTEDLAPIAETAKVVSVRPGLFDGPAEDAEAPGLDAPAVYVTLGTVAVFSTPELLGRVARGVAPVAGSVLLTTGPNDVTALGPLPDNVQVRRYVRQSLVLPQVELLVSHGGAGGTVAALAHGLPHLVIPGGGTSQQTISVAVERCGVGRRLVNPTEDETSAAAADLLSDPVYARAAGALRDALDELPGPAEGVRLLERLLS